MSLLWRNFFSVKLYYFTTSNLELPLQCKCWHFLYYLLHFCSKGKISFGTICRIIFFAGGMSKQKNWGQMCGLWKLAPDLFFSNIELFILHTLDGDVHNCVVRNNSTTSKSRTVFSNFTVNYISYSVCN